MSSNLSPTTEEIAIAFAEEVAALGGSVPDRYDDGSALFLRGVLPRYAEVRPGDRHQAGIALRATGPTVFIHPYTFRLICSNGAIMPHATQTHQVQRVQLGSALELSSAAIDAIRLTVRECARPEAFRVSVGQMRTASAMSADVMVHMMSAFSRLPAPMHEYVLSLISDVLEREVPAPSAPVRGTPMSSPTRAVRTPSPSRRDGRTVYAVANVVTAVARDTRDPAVKWDLEELGGGMLARLPVSPRAGAPAEAMAAV